jgi:hypothetical protein
MQTIVIENALSLIFGYLCGSIPFGILLTRVAGAPNLRSVGSGNIGATNVLRTGRKGLAAATLGGDMLKGTVAVVAIGLLGGREPALYAALGAFLGHLFPVWRQRRRHLHRPPSWPCFVARARGVLRHLARDRVANALFLARGLDRKRRDADRLVVERPRARSKTILLAHGAYLVHAPRQHRASY